jgi:acyl-coenzyme A thioesterase 9
MSHASPQEQAAFSAGEAAKIQRKAERGAALERAAPLPHELQSMHSMMNAVRRYMVQQGLSSAAQVRELPRSALDAEHTSCSTKVPALAMELTVMQNVFITQPQDRNTAGAVFGGLLMRRAYELAQSTALHFALRSAASGVAGAPVPLPRFMAIDDIAFVRPVQVGHLLTVRAEVVATQGSAAQVAVTCTTLDSSNATSMPVHTNSFHFTFACVQGSKGTAQPGAAPAAALQGGEVLPSHALAAVLPDTYAQVMAQIDGKRRLQQAQGQARFLGSAYSGVFDVELLDTAG